MADATQKRGSFRSALRHRDYRWLVLGLIVSMVGSWAYNVALAVYIYEQTQSAAWLAAATISRFVPVLLLSTYGGVLAERFERTRVMITSDLLSTGTMTLLAIAAAFDSPAVIAIVLASLTSIWAIVYFPAEAAMTPQIVGEEDLAAANALNSAIENVSVVVGPALGAGLLVLGPPAFAFAVNAATFAFAIWCLSRIETKSRPADVTEGGSAGAFAQMKVGFKAIRSSSTAALLVAGSVIASFYYGTDTVLFVIMSEEKLGTGPSGFGYLLAGLGVGGILAAGLVNRLASSPRLGRVIAIGLAVYAIPTAVLVVVDVPAIAFGLQVVRGAGTLVVDVLAITALQRSLDDELIARVFGVFMALAVGAMAVGALVTPMLLGGFGLDTTLLIYGLGTPVLIIAAYPRLARIDREGAARLAELEPRIAVLERLGIFAAASRPALEQLAAGVEEIRSLVGTTIIHQGAPARYLYVLVEGEVEVLVDTSDGRQDVVVTVAAPDIFGEIGLLENIPRTATVRVLHDATLYRIEGTDFLEAVSQYGSAGLFENALRRIKRTAPTYEATGELANVPTEPGPA